MRNVLAAVLATATLALSGAAHAQVTTSVYSGFTGSGDGTPFSGLVGTLQTPGITFATDTGSNWHPFGLSAFGTQSTATIDVAAAGSYTFTLLSDDGSRLFIDGLLVVDNGGTHGLASVSGNATLAAGSHALLVNFFEDLGGESGVDLVVPAGVTFAVPEPTTAALWLAGIAGLGALARRRLR